MPEHRFHEVPDPAGNGVFHLFGFLLVLQSGLPFSGCGHVFEQLFHGGGEFFRLDPLERIGRDPALFPDRLDGFRLEDFCLGQRPDLGIRQRLCFFRLFDQGLVIFRELFFSGRVLQR